MTGPVTTTTLTRYEIQQALWRKGELSFLLHSVQKEMYDTYKSADANSTLVWLLSRQFGKTYCLTVIALMEALKNPGCSINILTDTKLHMEEIILPKFDEIFEGNPEFKLSGIPEDLKPTYNKQRFKYSFSNRSSINFAGSDAGNAEKLRGKKAILVIVDEAGFCSNLKKIVQETLLPCTTHTSGKLILSSTPPENPDHDFNFFVEAAELEGYLTRKTIFDIPENILSKDKIDAIIKRYPGGINDDSFRREYLCHLVKDATKSVFPEVNDELLSKVVREFPKPPHYNCYVSMDVGFKDLTVVLFGYHDFRSNKIIIEDEIVKKGEDLRLKEFTAEIWKKEEELWTNLYTAEKLDPKFRVSDIEPIVTKEIYDHSNMRLYFNPVKKEPGYKAPLINRIRMMLVNGDIVINPRCKTLIAHLKNGRWANNQKDTFARSPGMGHYDALDALIYMIKVMNLNDNPFPHQGNGPNYFVNPNSSNSRSNDTVETLKAIFGGTRNKKR